MEGDTRRPTPPTELRIWDWLSLGLLLLFFGLGAVTQSRWVGASIVFAGGIVQLIFGTLAAVNWHEFADRLARYHARRPAILGGLLRQYGATWRLTGVSTMLMGAGLIAAAVMLVR
jgi:hypothetical protein